MITMILAIIGYAVADGDTLGAGLANAFEWVLVWYYITAALFAIFGVFVFGMGTAAGYSIGNSGVSRMLGAAFGAGASVLVLGLLAITIVVKILLVQYLVTISPEITEFSQIETNYWMAFIGVLLLALFAKFRTTASKEN